MKKTGNVRRGTIALEVLEDIVGRIVRIAKPERIVMFGSAARGTMGPNSDVDLLVVKRGRFSRGRLVEKIYSTMHGAGAAIDVVIVTPEEVERYRDTPCVVVCPALKEGKVLYAA